METNSWRSTQGEPASMPDGRSGDWKTQLQPEARQRIVNKIMDTLKKHLPISEPDDLNELQKIAIRFEEKIYTAAADQSDYLRKISQKMLSVDKKPQHSGGSGQINPSIKQNPVDPASLGIPAQINNQGQPVTTMNPPSTRQQLLPQNIHNNSSIASQSTSTLSSALPSIIGPSQSTISNVSQSSSLQNMTGISQNSVTNSLGQASATDIYSTAQRQMQGRQQQQQMISQQQHQSQNQLLYQQQQFQPQLLKQKLQQSTLSQSHVQQQSLLQQTTQLQSSQQPLIPVTSNLQSGQSSIQQTQPGTIQSIVQSALSQNSLSSVQQSGTSLLQQQSQSVSRQQQQPQSNMLQQTPLQQHQTSAPQHSNLPMQQHQQFMCQQSNIIVQQSQLVGQQTSGTEMQQQQQRLPTQQNNLLSMQQSKHLLNQQSMSLHQQQMLGAQTNISGLSQQQQQQQMLESLSNVSNVLHQRPMHVLQQAKTVVQQPQNQQAPLAMLQAQGQPQNQSLQQQQISHIQLQTAPRQQQLVQQHIGSLQRDMQQRVPASGSLLPQDAIEQQKQFVQSQMGLQEVSSSSTLDSIAPTGIVAVDLQEEIYQKVKSMKDLYFADLNDFYQWVSLKLQQNDALPSAKAAEQFQKMKGFKKILECILQVLQSPKANIHPSLKDKIPMYEKQILNILASYKRKAIPSQPPGQQQFQHPSNSQFVQQQQQTQISQLQQHDNYTNQQNNIQGSSNSMQAPAVQGMQHGSVPLSAQFGVTSQQNISTALQTGSTVDPVQGSSFSLLQPGAIAPMQQGGLVSARSSIAQQSNANVMPNASMNSSQNNAIAKQPSPNVMQQQHFKQEQQHLMSNPQLKQQLQQRHMQQHFPQQQQKQQLLQAQQPLQQQLQQQQQRQQQTSQMPLHQIQQLHQSNEVNDLRLRQAPGIKPGLCQQHYSTGQRHSYYQVKPGVAFPISSPQNFQASSPQASHNSSPQIDQRCQLSSQIKSGTPLQSANSPFVPSPSTPIDPSPIPGESEKQIASFTSLPNVGHQQTAIASQSQSLAVATPGISASPLLAEYSCPDGNQTSVLNLVTGKASTTERPLERLIEVIQSSTPEARSSAVSDIQSVVSMIDRIANSAPGNGSRAAVGEDLIAMTKCRLRARSFMSQDGSGPTKRIKRDISSMPLNNISSAGSINDSLKQSYGLDTSELESTATSLAKQQKFEVNHALIEEIRELNQWLIVTVVNISEEGIDSISAASEGKGTIVKCFFNAVALCPGLKSQFASEDMGPILPLRLFVPSNYPKSSPVLLDNLPDEQRESDDLSLKARSRFVIYLRSLSQPMSLGEMVKTWDACAQRVITEYAQQIGGGTFSSRHGAWENCVGA